MKSQIAEALQLKNEVIAVYRSDELPEGAIQFKPGKWGCVAAMVNAASKGRPAAFSDETTVCVGGRAGLGFAPYPHGWIERFLSDGEGLEGGGERYKKTQELALHFVDNVPRIEMKKYLILMPLSQLDETKQLPESVVFLVNPDRFSALVGLANFDTEDLDTVKLRWGAGCGQTILYALVAYENKLRECYAGMTDLSARKCIDKNLLSFAIPYNRFMEMEANVPISFFTEAAWSIIAKRLD